jgi:uncharacterized protein YfaS (alpha-2-macroglobulin family)
MAANYLNLKKYISSKFEWKESKDVISEVLKEIKDFQAPNGGMAYFTPTNDRVDPYLSSYASMILSKLKHMGYETPNVVEDKLDNYLLDMLKKDEMPSYYSKGMASSVRAVAIASLQDKGKIKSDMVKRYYEYAPDMDLLGKSKLLTASLGFNDKDSDKISFELLNTILGQSNESGGKITFNEAFDDGYRRMLSSTPRTNCAILSTLVKAYDNKKYAKIMGDLPQKLARTIRRMRGTRDHFENTQENVFCMNALVDYSKTFEKDEPKVTIKASIDGEKMGDGKLSSFKDEPLSLVHYIDKNDVNKLKKLEVSKEGKGTIYYSTIMRYAKTADAERKVNAGIEISREYSVSSDEGITWKKMSSFDKLKTGNLVRIDLFLQIPAARYQLAVDDRIPGGLEPLNTDLATTSKLDADKAEMTYGAGSLWFRFSDWKEYSYSFWSFNHKEIMHDRATFYAEYLPPGNYHLSYMTQVVAEGDFTIQPAFAEEMYDPDVYGKGLSGKLNVSDD